MPLLGTENCQLSINNTSTFCSILNHRFSSSSLIEFHPPQGKHYRQRDERHNMYTSRRSQLRVDGDWQSSCKITTQNRCIIPLICAGATLIVIPLIARFSRCCGSRATKVVKPEVRHAEEGGLDQPKTITKTQIVPPRHIYNEDNSGKE